MINSARSRLHPWQQLPARKLVQFRLFFDSLSRSVPDCTLQRFIGWAYCDRPAPAFVRLHSQQRGLSRLQLLLQVINIPRVYLYFWFLILLLRALNDLWWILPVPQFQLALSPVRRCVKIVHRW